MGLPIFFEPSKPNSTPERAEQPASDTRSGIRRRYVPVNDSRTVRNARRRRALLGLEHLEGNYDNFLNSQYLNPIATLTSHFGVAATEMRRNHMSRAARLSRAPTISRHERQPAGSMEAGGPSMPAVPESRDYVTPVSFGAPQRTYLLLDSIHEGRRGSRRMTRIRPYSTPPHTETDINSISGTRPSEVPAEGEINDRNMDDPSPSNPILFNRFTALAERDDGINTHDFSTQRHSVARQLRRLLRERDDAELVQEEMIRVRDIAQERQLQLDDDIREERRVERRLEERRRLEEIRERAQARIPADERERERELNDPLHAPESLPGSLALYVNTMVEQAGRAVFEPVEGGREEAARQVREVQQDSATHFRTMMDQARRRVEQVERERERVQDEVERAREQVERARERVQRAREQRDEVERARGGRWAHFDDRGFVNQIEQSSAGGLGDRERSLSPGGEGSWDAILITPDPQPPSASSSFASTAASRSQRDSANIPAGTPDAVTSFRMRFYEPPTDSNGNITHRQFGVPTNGDCDTTEPPGDTYSLMDLYRMNRSRRREHGAPAGFPLQFEQ